MATTLESYVIMLVEANEEIPRHLQVGNTNDDAINLLDFLTAVLDLCQHEDPAKYTCLLKKTIGSLDAKLSWHVLVSHAMRQCPSKVDRMHSREFQRHFHNENGKFRQIFASFITQIAVAKNGTQVLEILHPDFVREYQYLLNNGTITQNITLGNEWRKAYPYAFDELPKTKISVKEFGSLQEMQNAKEKIRHETIKLKAKIRNLESRLNKIESSIKKTQDNHHKFTDTRNEELVFALKLQEICCEIFGDAENFADRLENIYELCKQNSEILKLTPPDEISSKLEIIRNN